MSEEKKNLTDEERKELKEGLKKKIDEMSDDELDKVAGGWYVIISEETVNQIMSTGICPKCNQKLSDKSSDIALAHLCSGCKTHLYVDPPTPGVIAPSEPINVR